MADLQNHVVRAGQLDKTFGLFEIEGQRFFDQDGNARTQKFGSDLVMVNSRDRDHYRVDELQERSMAGERQAVKFLSDRLRLIVVHIGYSDKLDVTHPLQ